MLAVSEKGRDNQYKLHYGTNGQYYLKLTNPSNFIPFSIQGPYLKGLDWLGSQGLYWHENGQKRRLQIRLPNGKPGVIENRLVMHGWMAPGSSKLNNAWLVRDPESKQTYVYHINEQAKPQLITDYFPENAYPCLSRDANGHWWYPTSQGLERRDPSLTLFLDSDPNMVQGLHSLQPDLKGHMWFGGYTGIGGFSVFDGRSLRRIPHGSTVLQILPGSYRNPQGDLFFFTEKNSPLARAN